MSGKNTERIRRSICLYAPNSDYSKESRTLRWVDEKIKDNTLAVKDFNAEIKRFFVANYFPESLEDSDLSEDEARVAYKEAISFFQAKIKVIEWKLSACSDNDAGEVSNSDSRNNVAKDEIEARRLSKAEKKEHPNPFEQNRQVFR